LHRWFRCFNFIFRAFTITACETIINIILAFFTVELTVAVLITKNVVCAELVIVVAY
jgi:hypothetical protein